MHFPGFQPSYTQNTDHLQTENASLKKRVHDLEATVAIILDKIEKMRPSVRSFLIDEDKPVIEAPITKSKSAVGSFEGEASASPYQGLDPLVGTYSNPGTRYFALLTSATTSSTRMHALR